MEVNYRLESELLVKHVLADLGLLVLQETSPASDYRKLSTRELRGILVAIRKANLERLLLVRDRARGFLEQTEEPSVVKAARSLLEVAEDEIAQLTSRLAMEDAAEDGRRANSLRAGSL